MMNQDNPYAMNQTCKVCGEPAAGFHFGAFTCEGCKSFFGRSYNNLSSISECKNNGECIINKKNRTACKACRLRKCVLVGMSKSGSRYGRRSNWFKIHCLLQEQQQQAAAVMAAHHNNQQQAAAAAAAAQQHGAHGQKPPGGPSSAAAAAALGMLGHAGAYPGLYPPRTKEELMMLGLEEYAKHPAASPSVSSPDSHNSDSSVEVNVRGNALLHLSGKHLEAGVGGSASSGTPPHLRKDLPPFLPLHFPGLNAMPVMPPPAFLPPSHLLFPGYHPALYQHHQSLLKHSPEQQQAVAAAAAVQHLFHSNNAGAQHRFSPAANSVANSNVALSSLPLAAESHEPGERTAPSPKSDALNNNHIPNGSKAADELTKRFYLDAVLKSQRSSSPPPAATKIPTHSKHDHSISALVTPNSESGRERLKSRQSNEEDGAVADEDVDAVETQSPGEHDSDCGEEDVVVSMTPPRSPANARTDPVEQSQPPAVAPNSQDNPIDLSMKTGSSMVSSLSSKCSSTGSMQAMDSENEQEADMAEAIVAGKSGNCQKKNGVTYGVAFSGEGETAALNVNDERSNGSANDTHSNSLHYNNNNNNNNSKESTIVADSGNEIVECAKRKAEVSCSGETMLAATASVKRMKIELETLETLEPSAVKAVTTTPLDLTTKV